LSDKKDILSRINKLEVKSNDISQNIVLNQNTILSNIYKKLNKTELSFSDKATIATSLIAIGSILFVWFSSRAQLKELKRQNDAHEKQLEINQLEKQVYIHTSFLDNMLMKKEFNMELVGYLMKKLNFDKQEIIANKIKIYKDPLPNVELYKGNFNTYINFLQKNIDTLDIGVDVEDIYTEVTSLESEMNIFAYKLKSLKQILDKLKKSKYDELLIQVSFDLYFSYAKNLYTYGKIDDTVFSYYRERIAECKRN